MLGKLFGKSNKQAGDTMAPEGKPVGEVTHYYGKIGVAIVKFTAPVEVGAELRFHGATTDFTEKVASMQYDHKDIPKASKGKEVGIKISTRVREGDKAYLA